MFANNRKTIGVFIFRPVDEFQNKLCRGIIDGSSRYGLNVLFFTSFGDYAHNVRFVKGESCIVDLPPYEELDGAILVLDTIDIDAVKQNLIENVRERCHCPVVCVREEVSGMHNVVVDNDTSMESIFRHFIEEHGFERICFMTGKKGHEDAEGRLRSFQRVMEECQLPITDRQIFYGDFWKKKGKEACDHFLGGGYEPQVIICANDYMAVAVASELIDRGYRIPEDICVSGYDGVCEIYHFQPSITTACVPFYEMGVEAVSVIVRNLKKDCPLEKIYFPTKLVLAESCGCLNLEKQELIKSRKLYHDSVNRSELRQMETAFMSVHLEEVRDFDALADIIEAYIENVDGYKDYYLCLCEGLESGGKAFHTFTNDMEMRVGFRNGKRIKNKKISFSTRELLPAEVLDNGPQIFYFSPLHYKERCFGYEAISFCDSKETGNLYLSWSVNIENAIQDILLQNEMGRLIDELEELHVHDVLTGLFNRRGFEKYSQIQWSIAKKNGCPFFIMELDMDGLKYINDSFGHSEGDSALRVIGEALSFASEQGEICARTGGDEFCVCHGAKSEQEVNDFLGSVDYYLEKYNAGSDKPYKVCASRGFYYEVPEAGMTIENCLKISDSRIYNQKQEKRSNMIQRERSMR